MEALVHDILELSRIGQPTEPLTLVDPRPVLVQLQAELKPTLDAAGIEAVVEGFVAAARRSVEAELFQLDARPLTTSARVLVKHGTATVQGNTLL